MKFTDECEKHLNNERFSSSLNVKIAEKGSEVKYTISTLKEIASGKCNIHIGAADHIDSIDRKMAQDNWLHKHLCEVSKQCVGIDINKDSIRYLQDRYNWENLYCIDILKDNISFLSETKWDTVFLPDIIEHIFNVGDFLKALNHKLAGTCNILVVTLPNAFCLRNFKNAFFKKTETINSDHKYWFTPYTFAKLLTDAGFHSIEFDYTMRNKFRNKLFENLFKKTLLTHNPCLRDTIIFKARFNIDNKTDQTNE